MVAARRRKRQNAGEGSKRTHDDRQTKRLESKARTERLAQALEALLHLPEVVAGLVQLPVQGVGAVYVYMFVCMYVY